MSGLRLTAVLVGILACFPSNLKAQGSWQVVVKGKLEVYDEGPLCRDARPEASVHSRAIPENTLDLPAETSEFDTACKWSLTGTLQGPEFPDLRLILSPRYRDFVTITGPRELQFSPVPGNRILKRENVTLTLYSPTRAQRERKARGDVFANQARTADSAGARDRVLALTERAVAEYDEAAALGAPVEARFAKADLLDAMGQHGAASAAWRDLQGTDTLGLGLSRTASSRVQNAPWRYVASLRLAVESGETSDWSLVAGAADSMLAVGAMPLLKERIQANWLDALLLQASPLGDHSVLADSILENPSLQNSWVNLYRTFDGLTLQSELTRESILEGLLAIEGRLGRRQRLP